MTTHHDEMAAFCYFWRISPAQFWELTMPEYDAMGRFMDKHREEQQRAERRAARRRH